MAHKFIVNLTTVGNDVSILVRICRKWLSPGSNIIPRNLEIVMMDSDGTHIHACVPKDVCVKDFDKKIVEGGLYVVKNFRVMYTSYANLIVDNSLMIRFVKGTSVESTCDPNFPISVYKFQPFWAISEHSFSESGPLLDIIGHVLDVDYSMINGNCGRGLKYIRFRIGDVNSKNLIFVHFPPFSSDIKNIVEMAADKRLGRVVIIVQLATTMMFNEEFVLHNTDGSTKVIIYHHVCEAVEYLQRFDQKKRKSSNVINIS